PAPTLLPYTTLFRSRPACPEWLRVEASTREEDALQPKLAEGTESCAPTARTSAEIPGAGFEPARSCEQRLLRPRPVPVRLPGLADRKSTRLNSSHDQ